MKEHPCTEEKIVAALARICNTGPYTQDLNKSTVHQVVYHCAACGAELRFGTTVSIPSWAHYKPEHGSFIEKLR